MKGVTILYITMARIPGERAHSIQIARMCSALQAAGAEVLLISPKRGDVLSRKATMIETMKFYGLRTPFMHFRVPVPGILGPNIVAEYISWLLSVLVLSVCGIMLYTALNFVFRKNVYIFVREPLVLTIIGILGLIIRAKIIYELHEIPTSNIFGSKTFWFVVRRVVLIVCIAEFLAKLVRRQRDINEQNVVVLHDAVEDNLFCVKHGQPSDLSMIKTKSKVILYTGQLDSWKRPEFLIDMMQHINEVDVLLVFVGGKYDDLFRLKRYAEANGLSDRVLFLGLKPPSQIPRYLALADVLVHYSPLGTALSPLKIFEYMLSGRPIVAPNAPGVNEVLTDGVNALLFDPYNPADAARKVSLLLKDKELAERLASSAKNLALSKYTYKARAATLLNLLNTMTHQKN